jgi:DNA replication and repair protein RecF
MLSTIDVWNEKLASYGVLLSKYRNEAIMEINKYVGMYKTENEKLSVIYTPCIKDNFAGKDFLIKKLEESLDRDIEKGITMTGPHRDDFDVLLNGKSLRKYGSQGQTRTAVLKIKLAECEIIKNITGQEPVLLLDDVLSELDEKRREYFTQSIEGRQVIITCTDRGFSDDGRGSYFKVEDGKAKQIF